jgi:hypothetical protein
MMGPFVLILRIVALLFLQILIVSAAENASEVTDKPLINRPVTVGSVVYLAILAPTSLPSGLIPDVLVTDSAKPTYISSFNFATSSIITDETAALSIPEPSQATITTSNKPSSSTRNLERITETNTMAALAIIAMGAGWVVG